MKLQPCLHAFVDGRNAILLSDQDLSKADASKKIDELQQTTGRGT